MQQILLPIAAVGGMGLIFGALLAIAARIFAVEKDERIPLIVECLPGANCGGCGYAGCSAYAEAVAAGEAKMNCCPVGGAAVAAKIAEIMGVDADEEQEKMVACVMCSGTKDVAPDRYINDSHIDCHTAARIAGGMKECSFGCLGKGSCVAKCQFDAISIVDGIAVIDRKKCKDCGACILECPRNVIKRVPFDAKVTVKCSSHVPGKKTRLVCKVGCIGCGICVKNCESNAIYLENDCAVIDAAKCTECGVCVEKCPRKIIEMRQPEEEKEISIARKVRSFTAVKM